MKTDSWRAREKDRRGGVWREGGKRVAGLVSDGHALAVVHFQVRESEKGDRTGSGGIERGKSAYLRRRQAREETLVQTAARPIQHPVHHQIPPAIRALALARLHKLAEKSHPPPAAAAHAVARPVPHPAAHPTANPAANSAAHPAAAASALAEAKAQALARLQHRLAAAAAVAGEPEAPLADNTEAEAAAATALTLAKVRGRGVRWHACARRPGRRGGGYRRGCRGECVVGP
jgi:hypothetical protein